MGQVSAYLRSVESGFAHYCPGCEEMHYIQTKAPRANGAQWSFNGDVDKPTFSPSMRITGTYDITDDEHARIMRGEPFTPKPYCCHYVLTAGVINYCGDCTHALVGQSVVLPPLPRKFSDEGNP